MQPLVPNRTLSGVALALFAVGYLGATGLQAQTSSSPVRSLAPAYRSLLDQYCVSCHNDRLRTANLVLEKDKIDVEHVGAGADVWEKVLLKLRTGGMPPPGRPRPDQGAYKAFASWLETALDRAAAADPNPGRPALHRLNRTEYTNAIRDVLALDIDSHSWLPADDLSFGFDNNADILSVSPGLLERYMSVAAKISRLAVGDPTMRPVRETYKVSPLLLQDDRLSEDLPFGSRGGIAVRHYFPLDAEYAIRIRLQRDGIYNIRGLAEPQQIDVRLDGERVKQFTVGGQIGTTVNGSYVKAADADAGLEVRLAVKAGSRLIGVSFPKRVLAVGGVVPARLPVANFILSPTARALGFAETMGVASVEVGGPYNAHTPAETPSRRDIFVCLPSSPSQEEPCASKILSRLARRAYRRPVTEEDVETLLGFYRTARRGASFDAGVQRALARMLVDPEFLYRFEPDPSIAAPGAAYRLSDLEVASRLSFFLWSSIPDEELLDVAARGKLKDQTVLARQVRRMLADRRSSALVGNFATQWLHLRNMRVVAPDVNLFPEFDENLREAFQRETELFVESQLREDRSVSELLTANYTFLNERLARHYGVPSVFGGHFRRVTLSDGTRGGLLGQGSLLTITSHATRTSPVLRGKWILDNLLGTPPPPPPPNVPALPDDGDGGKAASMRERMEQHRKNPVCASCHSRMDPLGFALENFDGIGKWRTKGEGETAIDTAATLPDGTTFNGPSELRSLLLSRRDEFAATVTTKLLTYALGRGVEYYDLPSVRTIVRESAAGDYRWSSIILGIARSVPFRMSVKRQE
jgi:mono/diheme cytochrome c family protein